MSAWYLFSMLGFYPLNPCGGEYVIGAPQLSRAVIGKRFAVTARGLTKENKYVKSVKMDGKELKGGVLRHAEIVSGGELAFEMRP